MMTQSHHLCDTKLFAIKVGALASVLLVLATPPMLAQTSHPTGQAQLNKSTAIGCETLPQNDLTFRLDAAGIYGQGIRFDPNYLRQNEKELRQAIESSPFNLKAHLNLAEVLAGLGLERPSAYDEAIGIYKQPNSICKPSNNDCNSNKSSDNRLLYVTNGLYKGLKY